MDEFTAYIESSFNLSKFKVRPLSPRIHSMTKAYPPLAILFNNAFILQALIRG